MRAVLDVTLPKELASQPASGQGATASQGAYLNIEKLHQIFSSMGLEPPDMPKCSWETEKDRLRKFFEDKAADIFERMPENNPEEKERVAFARLNIIYASQVPPTASPFMVVMHTNDHIRFRLANSRLEVLQRSCKDLVKILNTYNQSYPELRLSPVWSIRIFEHGHEDSTIQGDYLMSRFKYARRVAGGHLVVTMVTLALFVLSVLVGLIQNEVGHPALIGFFERLQTAMAAAAIVAFINLYHYGLRKPPPIVWSVRLDESRS